MPIQSCAQSVSAPRGKRYTEIGLLLEPYLDGLPRAQHTVGGDRCARAQAHDVTGDQGLTLVHFSAEPQPFWSHLPVSPNLIDWGKIMHPMYPTKCAHVELKSGRVSAPAGDQRGGLHGIDTALAFHRGLGLQALAQCRDGVPRHAQGATLVHFFCST
jgi:hypothetical protein